MCYVFIKLSVWILNLQRQIYVDSAAFGRSDSNAALRTEVRHECTELNNCG